MLVQAKFTYISPTALLTKIQCPIRNFSLRNSALITKDVNERVDVMQRLLTLNNRFVVRMLVVVVFRAAAADKKTAVFAEVEICDLVSHMGYTKIKSHIVKIASTIWRLRQTTLLTDTQM